MPIDWIMGLLGGLLIGSAAALYLLISGRIMGASGILGGLVDGTGGRTSERLAFIAALIGVPLVISVVAGPLETHLTSNLFILIIAGLAVGVGTRLANGCTSGHGVCGISRLSARAIAATVIYLLAGAVCVGLAKHVLGVI